METNPKYKSAKFKCPHCHVVARQDWFFSRQLSSNITTISRHLFFDYRKQIRDYEQEAIETFLNFLDRDFPKQINTIIPSQISIATCQSCRNFSIWVNEQIVYPKRISIEPPNEDLSDEIKSLYDEAAKILIDSHKGAAALLRLALQKFLNQIGKEGKNINKDIKELVEEGLSPKIQKALDLLRVVGNNAVHPGQINIDDNREIALKLFKILNMIAEELITKPKEIDSLYVNIVPEETKEHINQRDGKKR